MNDPKILITKLAEILEEKNISQYQVGKEAGMSRSSVKRLFDFENSPSLANFLAVAKVAGVTIVLKKNLTLDSMAKKTKHDKY